MTEEIQAQEGQVQPVNPSNSQSRRNGTEHSPASNPNNENTQINPSPDNNEKKKGCIWKNELFWFLCFTLIVSMVTIWRMEKANSTLKSSHDLILRNDSLIKTDLRGSLESICISIAKDSLMSDSQRIYLSKNISDIIDIATQKNFEDKATGLLEMEFTKIQNEYEVLNLWCALLTVVFLIFSFFSIFKTNEMSRQGEEALERLHATTIEAKGKTASIDEKVTEAEARITKKETTLVEQLNSKMMKLTNELTTKDNQIKALSKKIEQQNTSLTEIESNKTKALNEIKETIKSEEAILLDKISKAVDLEAKTQLELITNQIIQLSNDQKRLNDIIPRILSQIQVRDSSRTDTSDTDENPDVDYPTGDEMEPETGEDSEHND